MGLMGQRQDQSIEEVNQFKNTTKAAVSKMETRLISFDNRLKELEDDHRHKNTELKKLKEDVVEHSEGLAKLNHKADDLGVRVDDREKDTRLS